jgi:nucleotidyltransferase substrate binding protein (TIGR01987 family)
MIPTPDLIVWLARQEASFPARRLRYRGGIETKSPKDSLRAAFGQGWILDEDGFLDMLSDRNKTSHIYSREESQKIYDRITKQHIPLIKAVALRLQSLG